MGSSVNKINLQFTYCSEKYYMWSNSPSLINQAEKSLISVQSFHDKHKKLFETFSTATANLFPKFDSGFPESGRIFELFTHSNVFENCVWQKKLKVVAGQKEKEEIGRRKTTNSKKERGSGWREELSCASQMNVTKMMKRKRRHWTPCDSVSAVAAAMVALPVAA